MKKIVTKTLTTEVVDDVLCDLCGKSTQLFKNDINFERFSYGTLKFNGCYGSEHDGTIVNLEICETCTFSIVDRRISGNVMEDMFIT